MTRTRVLVAEDSLTVRQQLCDVLRADPEIELLGVATNGQEAVELARLHRPDVITMDMMMPIMTGLAATEQIMAYSPTPILVVSSSFNRGELFKMYDALAAGAVDVLEKPSGDEPEGVWERKFLSQLKLVSRIRVITHIRAKARTPTLHPTQPKTRASTPPTTVIAIGASTGGPRAAIDVLRSIPPDIGVPILFVIHINPQFGSALADWLDGQSPFACRFPVDGEPLTGAAGQVILAPPGLHLLVRDGRLHGDDGPERYSCKPSVDVLFESLARECGPGTAAALLTGMGRDGASGLLAIRQAGGQTIAQDEATSVVYGMPREAALIGGAAQILPLGEIGPALTALVRAGRVLV